MNPRADSLLNFYCEIVSWQSAFCESQTLFFMFPGHLNSFSRILRFIHSSLELVVFYGFGNI